MRRRTFLLRGGSALAGLVIGQAPEVGRQAIASSGGGVGPCILGYSNQSGPTDIPTLEGVIGRKFHGLRQNRQLTDAGALTWGTAITDYDAGRGPANYRSIQLNTGTYADITGGTYDATLTTWFTNLMAAGRWTPTSPAILCFMHEVALSSNDFLGTSQQFIDTYRYVRNLGDTVGVSRRSKTGAWIGGPAIWAYIGWNRMFDNTPVDTHQAGRGIDDYDPNKGTSPAPTGTSYYEIIGSDPYNDNQGTGILKYGTDAATLLAPIKAAALARNMQWMCGEMGCQDGSATADHLVKAQWLDNVRRFIVGCGRNLPGSCAYVFTTQETGSLYNWDSSQEALQAGMLWGKEPFFG